MKKRFCQDPNFRFDTRATKFSCFISKVLWRLCLIEMPYYETHKYVVVRVVRVIHDKSLCFFKSYVLTQTNKLFYLAILNKSDNC